MGLVVWSLWSEASVAKSNRNYSHVPQELLVTLQVLDVVKQSQTLTNPAATRC